MNDWERALWMIEEGFTVKELKGLLPSDADAWVRLKPLVIVPMPFLDPPSVLTKTTTEKNDGRHYHVWQCVKRREYSRPHGRPMSTACGKWNVKTSKYAEPSRNIQGNCGWCGRRARLNPNELLIHTFTSKKKAVRLANHNNKEMKQ